MAKIVVVEMCERDLCSITECKSLEDGVEKANELLLAHMKKLGYEACFEDGEDEDDEWGRASLDNLNAWCNYRGQNWDVHIAEC